MRNKELDGLRGLAALAVALGHCNTRTTGLDVWASSLSDFPTMTPTEIAGRLLHVVFPADAAVIVFFVLSGYVLWGSFQRNVQNPFLAAGPYVIGRAYRLLPVAIVSALITGLLANGTAADVARNALLLDYNLNGVIWSLQVEVVGSLLIFAVFALCAVHLSALPMAVLATGYLGFTNPHYLLLFLPTFLLGAALHYTPPAWLKHRTIAAASLLALISSDLVWGHGVTSRATQFAAAFALVGSVAALRPTFLASRPAQFLGDISYPFYLLHTFGLLAAAHLQAIWGLTFTDPFVEMAFLAVASLTVSIPLAWAVHVLVEKPGMRAGSDMHRAARSYLARFLATQAANKGSSNHSAIREGGA